MLHSGVLVTSAERYRTQKALLLLLATSRQVFTAAGGLCPNAGSYEDGGNTSERTLILIQS